MAKWQCSISTKDEFSSRLKRTPELIFVRGMLNGRFGLESLVTVLDEVQEAYVTNTQVGWSALVVCGSGKRPVLFAPSLASSLKTARQR
jgi:hypothetical protein